MKKCPNCQREFPDEMRFCQTDGTPLDEVAAEPVDPLKTQIVSRDEIAEMLPPVDPFKTMVASQIEEKDEEEDVLQLPQNFDPMATMVVSPIGQDKASLEDLVAETPGFDAIKEEIHPETPPEPPIPVSTPIIEPPAPVFAEPIIDAPSFSVAPPPAAEPIEEDLPPTVIQSPYEVFSAPTAPEPTPVSEPVPPPFQPAAFDPPQSAFPASPFETPEPVPTAPPLDTGWNPPPAPVQEWQQQPIGADTPFQPPAVSGPSSTLALVSLILGIVAVLLLIPTLLVMWCGILSIILGVTAVILGFLARGRAKSNPDQYGGAGMALIGLITGGFSVIASIGWMLFMIIVMFGILAFGR